MVLRKLGPSQSPVVSDTVTRFKKQKRARSALRWGAVTSVAMVLVLADLYFCFISTITSLNFYIIRLTEFIVLVCLALSVLYDLFLFLGTTLRNPKIKLTSKQKEMLGVTNKSTGFQTVTSFLPFGTPSSSNHQFKPTTPIATPFSSPVTPVQYYCSPGSSHSTPHSISIGGHTPKRQSPGSSYRVTPAGERISSRNHLEQYLRSEEDKEERMKRGSPDLSFPGQSPGYWYGNQSSTGTPTLRKYHVATRSLSFSEDKQRKDLTSIWNKVGIKKEQLSQSTEKCRKWLAKTILAPVAKEIKSVNESLMKMGSTESCIGNASLSHLKDLTRLRSHQYPNLSMLIRYLEISPNQDYLVKRILELSEMGGIGNYCWDGGGIWKGKKWNPELPNDTQILLHFFCTYLDGQLPPTPQYPDGKTFTSQYLLKTPDKPDSKKDSICLYQSSINPPHMKVLCKTSCIDIPIGRNNFFHSLIVFLYHVKNEEKGLLSQLDLELSGLNLLWIIEDIL